jgi:hypothetical protein
MPYKWTDGATDIKKQLALIYSSGYNAYHDGSDKYYLDQNDDASGDSIRNSLRY